MKEIIITHPPLTAEPLAEVLALFDEVMHEEPPLPKIAIHEPIPYTSRNKRSKGEKKRNKRDRWS